MANSLNAYKLDDQTLKLVLKKKDSKKEVFPRQTKIKGNNGDNYAKDDSSALTGVSFKYVSSIA